MLDTKPPAPFIVGVPRSGTTLLRMMLDAHPDLAIPPETYFIPAVANRCRRERKPSLAHACVVETLRTHERWPEFHLDADELRQQSLHADTFCVSDAVRGFYGLYAARFGKLRWGDKTPGYLGDMQLISELLPEAHFIHVIRDGRDVALSINGLWFGPDSVHEAASWWVNRITLGREQVTRVPFYLEIRYEDLILDTERTLRRVCEFIELPWDPVMLEYHTRSDERLRELNARSPRRQGGPAVTSEQRLKIHESATQPPMASRVAVWKREMQDADRRWFEIVAGDLLHELGYEIASARPGSRPFIGMDGRP